MRPRPGAVLTGENNNNKSPGRPPGKKGYTMNTKTNNKTNTKTNNTKAAEKATKATTAEQAAPAPEKTPAPATKATKATKAAPAPEKTPAPAPAEQAEKTPAKKAEKAPAKKTGKKTREGVKAAPLETPTALPAARTARDIPAGFINLLPIIEERKTTGRRLTKNAVLEHVAACGVKNTAPAETTFAAWEYAVKKLWASSFDAVVAPVNDYATIATAVADAADVLRFFPRKLVTAGYSPDDVKTGEEYILPARDVMKRIYAAVAVYGKADETNTNKGDDRAKTWKQATFSAFAKSVEDTVHDVVKKAFFVSAAEQAARVAAKKAERAAERAARRKEGNAKAETVAALMNCSKKRAKAYLIALAKVEKHANETPDAQTAADAAALREALEAAAVKAAKDAKKTGKKAPAKKAAETAAPAKKTGKKAGKAA